MQTHLAVEDGLELLDDNFFIIFNLFSWISSSADLVSFEEETFDGACSLGVFALQARIGITNTTTRLVTSIIINFI